MTARSPATARIPGSRRRPLSRGERMLRVDNSGWPFTADVTPFTIGSSSIRSWRWTSATCATVPGLEGGWWRPCSWRLQVVHLIYEPPAARYGTRANGMSSVPHALGRPNLLGIAAPALGVASVVVPTLLSGTVLVAFALLIREARSTPSPHATGPATHPSGTPVAVVAYDPAWPQLYASAAAELLGAVGQRFVRLEHIGSTAVPGLAAKPTIDMMASVTSLQDGLAAGTALAELGYQLVDTGMPDRLLFQRRAAGTPSHHLHVVTEASWPTRNERILRDYLRSHPEQARRYGELKRRLARHLRSGEAYTRAKTALIQKLVDAARDELGLLRVPVWEE
jgi:GrpB-like predicted nucleotidyltransferase (UPF0157 family)